MISNAQLKAIMLCTKTTIYGGVTNPLYAGLRGAGTLTIEDAEMIADYMERDHRNKIGMKTEFTTLQWGMTEIAKLITHIKTNQGCDMQVITETPALTGGSYVSPYGGVFDFAGTNFAGLNFELIRTPKEFSSKITAEALYDYATGIGIIAAAATKTWDNTLRTSVGGAGLEFSKVLRPNITSVIFGTGSDLLCDKEEIKDFRLTTKTVGEKTMYGRTTVNMLNCEVELTILDASVQKISSIFSADQNTQITVNLVDGANTEAWIYKLLTYKNTIKIDDKLRTQTLLFKGNAYLSDVATSVGTSAKTITFN